MNRRDLLTSAGAGLSLAAVPNIARAGSPLLVPEPRFRRIAAPPATPPGWSSRAVADARLSATMDAVGLAAFTQKGVLVQSRSTGPLYEPPGNFMQQAPGGGGGCDPSDGCENNGWSDGDGTSIYGYSVTQNQTQPPAQPGDPPTIVTVIVVGWDVGVYPALGNYNGGVYYPQVPPIKPQHPNCLQGALTGSLTAATAINNWMKANWKSLGQIGATLLNYVKLYGPVANSEPIAFLEGLSAIAGAPEFATLLLIAGVSIGTYVIWKSCYAQ